MTEKETAAAKPRHTPREETYLDLATKEIVTITEAGEKRSAPEEAVFDFYVSVKRFPTRNG